jgi:hypothetical protein
MTYSKPEVAVLGEAASLIQGSKAGSGDPGGLPIGVTDCELDD